MRYDEIPKFKNFSIDTNLAYGFVGYINFIHDAVQFSMIEFLNLYCAIIMQGIHGQ